MTGRKRHLAVDTLGLVLAVAVHAANVQDRDGAKLVLAKLVGRFPRLGVIWADGGYAGTLLVWALAVCGFVEDHMYTIVKNQLSYDKSPTRVTWQESTSAAHK